MRGINDSSCIQRRNGDMNDRTREDLVDAKTDVAMNERDKEFIVN